MTTVKHGIDHAPLLRKLQKALHTEPDPLRQMVGIELLMWLFAKSIGDEVAARTAINGMHKHALQMLMQTIFPDENAAGYKHFSHTSSGWEISNNPDAPRELKWRAVHPKYGERFFAEHDEILPFTLRHMMQQAGFPVHDAKTED